MSRRTSTPRSRGRMVALRLPALTFRSARMKGLAFLLLISNIGSHYLFNPRIDALASLGKPLYLMDEAKRFIPETKPFRKKVEEVAEKLRVPPEWLMAVMYAESRFNTAVLNHKGSGAVGLIQIMPETAKELKVSSVALKEMDPVMQMDYVFAYLDQVRGRYGEYMSLTDLYLGILYPKARGQDPCYALYFKPSKAYRQNTGLDENKDGVVTVSDIDKRMQRLFLQAYVKVKEV